MSMRNAAVAGAGAVDGEPRAAAAQPGDRPASSPSPAASSAGSSTSRTRPARSAGSASCSSSESSAYAGRLSARNVPSGLPRTASAPRSTSASSRGPRPQRRACASQAAGGRSSAPRKRASASWPASSPVRRSMIGTSTGTSGVLEEREDLLALLLGAQEPARHLLGVAHGGELVAVRADVQLVAALAGALGRVHRGVGLAHEVLRRGAVAADADADGGERRVRDARRARAAPRGRRAGARRSGRPPSAPAMPCSRTANSSPPRRAAVSMPRRVARRRSATPTSSSSPAAWPERVVDGLEVVEVDERDGHEPVVARRRAAAPARCGRGTARGSAGRSAGRAARARAAGTPARAARTRRGCAGRGRAPRGRRAGRRRRSTTGSQKPAGWRTRSAPRAGAAVRRARRAPRRPPGARARASRRPAQRPPAGARARRCTAPARPCSRPSPSTTAIASPECSTSARRSAVAADCGDATTRRRARPRAAPTPRRRRGARAARSRGSHRPGHRAPRRPAGGSSTRTGREGDAYALAGVHGASSQACRPSSSSSRRSCCATRSSTPRSPRCCPTYADEHGIGEDRSGDPRGDVRGGHARRRDPGRAPGRARRRAGDGAAPGSRSSGVSSFVFGIADSILAARRRAVPAGRRRRVLVGGRARLARRPLARVAARRAHRHRDGRRDRRRAARARRSARSRRGSARCPVFSLAALLAAGLGGGVAAHSGARSARGRPIRAASDARRATPASRAAWRSRRCPASLFAAIGVLGPLRLDELGAELARDRRDVRRRVDAARRSARRSSAGCPTASAALVPIRVGLLCATPLLLAHPASARPRGSSLRSSCSRRRRSARPGRPRWRCSPTASRRAA